MSDSDDDYCDVGAADTIVAEVNGISAVTTSDSSDVNNQTLINWG